MARHDYHEKLEESEDGAIRRILAHVYRKFFPFLERIEYSGREDFQRSGRDLVIHFKKPNRSGMAVHVSEYVEEKIRSKGCADYRDLLIEYLSSAEHNTLGWGFTSTAHWLSYIQNGLPDFVRVHLLPMQPLRKWFMAWYERYEEVESRTYVGNRCYTTLNKAVPFNDPVFKIFCAAHGMKVKELNADEIRRLTESEVEQVGKS